MSEDVNTPATDAAEAPAAKPGRVKLTERQKLENQYRAVTGREIVSATDDEIKEALGKALVEALLSGELDQNKSKSYRALLRTLGVSIRAHRPAKPDPAPAAEGEEAPKTRKRKAKPADNAETADAAAPAA